MLALQSSRWPKPLTEELVPFQRRAEELAVVKGLVMWGQRVIIPLCLRNKVKHEPHEGHFGSQRMKSLARSYVWWSNMDSELEAMVAACGDCNQAAKDPPKTAINPWPMTLKPWTRLHVDYAGPVEGWMLLIVVDSYSKWIDALPTHSTTTQVTTKLLKQLFAIHGLPEVIVSDNGTCFSSSEFSSFCLANGIRHLTSAPYCPASNGLAERAVQTIEGGLKKQQGVDKHQRLARFLLNYRCSPQSTTGCAPAELLFGRNIRSRLDLVRPSLENEVHAKQKNWPGFKTKEQFSPEIGTSVYARNYGAGSCWVPGIVSNKPSQRSILVTSSSGVLHRHPNQLRRSNVKFDITTANEDDDEDWLWLTAQPAKQQQPQAAVVERTILCRSNRAHKPPERLTI